MSPRYKVFVNRRVGRVLVSGKPEDEALIDEGWRVIHENNDWRAAFEFARDYADSMIIFWSGISRKRGKF
jgi:hypothetical protein